MDAGLISSLPEVHFIWIIRNDSFFDKNIGFFIKKALSGVRIDLMLTFES